MLMLTRKLNQRIIINGNIIITVKDVEGFQVTLGIQAPPEVSVDREEIHKRKIENPLFKP